MRIFDEKKASLLPNQFVEKALQGKAETESGNGSLKYVTSNDVLTDQFALISNYKEPRSYADIANDCEALWKYNPTICVKFAIYVRMITRDTKVGNETLKSQIGQGLKHEGIFRLMWLAINHKKTFMKNIHLFIAAGSWKDIIQMLSLDLQYHGVFKRKLDWEFLGNTIVAGLNNPEYDNLIKKYLPTIRSAKACKTVEAQANNLVGKFIAKKLYGIPTKEGDFSTYAKYRRLKNSGTAHLWQQKISKQDYLNIDFDTVAGRALALLAGSKFLANQGLEEKYTNWIISKPVAKYTGYVYELFKPLEDASTTYQRATIDKQFAQLIQNAKGKIESTFLVVRDVSSSMECRAVGTNVSSNTVAKAMALYFSEFLIGPFHEIFLSFEHTVRCHKWEGETPSEKWKNDAIEAFGNTNFLGVADFFVRMKLKGVSEDEFPSGILCISDGEFDRVSDSNVSNFIAFKQKLLDAGFSFAFVHHFKIVLWDIPNYFYSYKPRPKFETFADAPNFFYMSGFDPAAIAFLFGDPVKQKAEPKTASELARAALDQDLLNLVRICKEPKPKILPKN